MRRAAGTKACRGGSGALQGAAGRLQRRAAGAGELGVCVASSFADMQTVNTKSKSKAGSLRGVGAPL